MNQLVNFLVKLFDTEGFPPRWLCGSAWDLLTGWMHIFSDIVIWLAYFCIPSFIWYFIKKQNDEIPFKKVLYLFAAFVFCCGTIHLIEASLFWYPWYRLSGLVKFITAIVSVMTAYELYKIFPQLLQFKSPEELEKLLDIRSQELQKSIKELSDLKQRNDLALESAKVGVWSWDIKANIVVFDDMMYQLFGADDTNMFQSYEAFRDNFVIEEDRDTVHNDVTKAVQETGEYNVEYRIQYPSDQSIHHIAARAKVYYDKQRTPIKMTGTCIDIDERKKQEEIIISKTAELERSNKDLEQFAYITSHDLQEPLRMVATYVDLLFDHFKDQGVKYDDKSEHYASLIEIGIRRMRRMIKDILDYSKLGKLAKVEDASIAEVLNLAKENLEGSIRDSSADIEVRGDLPVIKARPTELVQLFQNLIGNAIKFKKEGVKPKVIVQVSRQSRNKWLFSVQDNGVGINPEYFEKIFHIFHRLENTLDEGTGIGLTLCQKIVEDHKGKIWLESKEGEGTTFYFTLKSFD